tara:strand:- start:300 stop:1055 length:756 start_codon:yes stop_codon:yes gene_type:complete
MSKLINNFIKDLTGSVIQTSNHWNKRLSVSLVRDKVLSRYSSDKITKVLSDDYWIGYPSYTYDRTNPRSNGGLLRQFVIILRDHDPELFDVALKKSKGIIHCFALDSCGGRKRVLSARRGKKSKDKRVRLRSAKILPVKEIHALKKDPHNPVRNIVIKRLGLDNCFGDFLDDKCRWIKTRCQGMASIDDLPYKEILNESGDKHRVPLSVITNIISQLSDEELVYYLDYPDKVQSDYIKEAVSEILTSRLTR